MCQVLLILAKILVFEKKDFKSSELVFGTLISSQKWKDVASYLYKNPKQKSFVRSLDKIGYTVLGIKEYARYEFHEIIDIIILHEGKMILHFDRLILHILSCLQVHAQDSIHYSIA